MNAGDNRQNSQQAGSASLQTEQEQLVEGSNLVDLSIVIPAWNEEKRLPRYLAEVMTYCHHEFRERCEIILVDDGSRNRLAETVCSMIQSVPRVQVLRHAVNRGKGCAIRTGVVASTGKFVLFADADGATPIGEERKLRAQLDNGYHIAIGTRSAYNVQRTCLRRCMAHVFACVRQHMTGLRIQDTQCGFKMFRGDLCRSLVRLCPRDDYLFDVALLLAAQELHLLVREVDVMWTEVSGSKIRPFRDSMSMVLGLFLLQRQVRKQLSAIIGPLSLTASDDHSRYPEDAGLFDRREMRS